MFGNTWGIPQDPHPIFFLRSIHSVYQLALPSKAPCSLESLKMLLKVLDCELKLQCPLLMHPSMLLLQPFVAMGIWETASLMCALITLSQE